MIVEIVYMTKILYEKDWSELPIKKTENNRSFLNRVGFLTLDIDNRESTWYITHQWMTKEEAMEKVENIARDNPTMSFGIIHGPITEKDLDEIEYELSPDWDRR